MTHSLAPVAVSFTRSLCPARRERPRLDFLIPGPTPQDGTAVLGRRQGATIRGEAQFAHDTGRVPQRQPLHCNSTPIGTTVSTNCY